MVLKGWKVSDLINKSPSREAAGALTGEEGRREGQKCWERLDEEWKAMAETLLREAGSSVLRLRWNAHPCWQRRNGPGDKVFHIHNQHPAAEPRDVALLSMQRLIRQTFKEQGPTSNEDSREAVFIHYLGKYRAQIWRPWWGVQIK